MQPVDNSDVKLLQPLLWFAILMIGLCLGATIFLPKTEVPADVACRAEGKTYYYTQKNDKHDNPIYECS